MRLDLHVHLKRSHSLEHLRSTLQKRRLDGIAITNFWNISYAKWVRERLPEYLILVGKEVVSSKGHILAIGIDENIPDFKSPRETIDRIHDQGGVAILPHPFLIYNSVVPAGENSSLPFDAVEIFNYRAAPFLWPNGLAALRFAFTSLPRVANSDAKDIVSIGSCYNDIPGTTAAEVLANLRAGQITRHTEMVWPTPRWAFNFLHLYLTHHKSSNCAICGAVLIRTVFKKTITCEVCGKTRRRRIICPNGHGMCKACRTERDFKQENLRQYRSEMGLEI